jgi:hypothetical protein
MRRDLGILAAVLGIGLSATAAAKDLTGNSNLRIVRDLYERVLGTLPSGVNAAGNAAAIRDRLKCYEENHSYTQRIQVCNNAYVKRIVGLARETIHSRPNIGEFVLNVDKCPILYNLCMGQTEQDRERCVLFERQCIDYTLDVFWRGSAQYTQQTYRLDR